VARKIAAVEVLDSMVATPAHMGDKAGHLCLRYEFVQQASRSGSPVFDLVSSIVS